MQALRRHYEKIVLGVFLVLLLALSAFLMRGLREIGNLAPPRPAQDDFVALSDADFTATQALSNPQVQWERKFAGDSTLFKPGVSIWCNNSECTYWIPIGEGDDYVCPYCGEEQGPLKTGEINSPTDEDADGDGIDDVIEEKYEFLSAENKLDADQDYDEDWFSNLEEIKAGTDPADKTSYPLLINHVTLVDVRHQNFDIVLSNVVVGATDDPPEKWDIVLQVVEEGRWKTRFLKLGGTINGYKIATVDRKFRERFDPKLNDTVREDVSQITLQKEGEEPMVLGRQKIATAGVVIRLFLYHDPLDPRKGGMYAASSGEVVTFIGADEKTESYAVTARGRIEAVLLRVGDAEARPIRIRRRRLESHRRAADRARANAWGGSEMPPEAMMGPGMTMPKP